MQKVYDWIDKSFIPRKTVNRQVGSYSLKHYLQEQTGIYVSEKEFQDAMKHCGFEPMGEQFGHHYYGISTSSPVFVAKKRKLEDKDTIIISEV